MERQYKDSGIDWIGRIPKEWGHSRFKYAGSFTKGKLPENQNVESRGLPIIGASEMLGKEPRTFSEDINIPQCNKDSILILWDGANAGIIANKCEGIVSSTTVKYDCKDNRYNRQYMYYLLKFYENYFKNKVGGTTIPHMNHEYIDDCICLLPSLSEQNLIADYLDKKCGEIDELIEVQEQMIRKLTFYKQSVITEAVTKGLNPNVRLVPSDIDWIKDIPEEWATVRIKFLFNRRSEKNFPVKTKERLSLSIDKGVTLYSEKTTNLDRFKDDFAQYQLAYPNDIVLNSMNMIVGAVGLSKYKGCVSPVYYVLYSRKDINMLYYSYLLNCQPIRDVYHSMGKGIYAIERGEGRVNTCRLKVSYDDFGSIIVPFPNKVEQDAIALSVTKKCSEIDTLIELKQQKIEKLNEYKKSVIYEAVTGKFDIR